MVIEIMLSTDLRNKLVGVAGFVKYSNAGLNYSCRYENGNNKVIIY